MKRRNRAWRAGNVQTGTRRQVMEDALVEERVALWRDFARVWDGWADGELLEIALRIRRISEALGYPTSWRAVPERMLIAYEATETVWPLGITAEAWDRDELDEEPVRIDDEFRAALRQQADEMSRGLDPGDLDG